VIDLAFDSLVDGQCAGFFNATGMHPIWTTSGGWIAGESIRAGVVLVSSDGWPLEVL
jgi:hypothetical protein